MQRILRSREWKDGIFSLVSCQFFLPVGLHWHSDLSMESAGEWMESDILMESEWTVNE